METIISIQNLTKIYGTQKVLDIPELNFYKGQSLGLVGNNGAGKTTLFRAILDLIAPATGTVHIKGIPVSNSESWKTFTGSFIDESFLIDYLTPQEYFDFLGKLHGWNKEDVKGALIQFDSLFQGEILNNKKYIRDLSKGNQKKVGIAGALLCKPEILILDEPFANLDPSSQFLLRQMLSDLDKNTDITMIISSHDLLHITEFCERFLVLHKGLIVKDELRKNETLAELQAYFQAQIMPEEEQPG